MYGQNSFFASIPNTPLISYGSQMRKCLLHAGTPRNSQNDRLYVHSAVKKRDVAGRRLLSTRSGQFSRSVMVSVAVSTLGCSTSWNPVSKLTGVLRLPQRISGAFLATGTFFSRLVREHIEHALQWISWKEKCQSSFRRYCVFQIRQI